MPRRRTQNLATTDPNTGAAGYVFPGGLQIPAGNIATPPTDRRIRWLRQTDGALVAEIFGTENLARHDITIQAKDDLSDRNGSDALLRASAAGDASAAVVRALANTTGGTGDSALVDVSTKMQHGAMSFAKTLLDEHGASDFLTTFVGESGGIGAGFNLWGGAETFFLPNRVKKMIFVMWSSGYVGAAAQVDYRLVIDGVTYGYSQMFFNVINDHKMMGAIVGITGQLDAGNHTIAASNPFSSLIVDGSDSNGYIGIGG